MKTAATILCLSLITTSAFAQRGAFKSWMKIADCSVPSSTPGRQPEYVIKVMRDVDVDQFSKKHLLVQIAIAHPGGPGYGDYMSDVASMKWGPGKKSITILTNSFIQVEVKDGMNTRGKVRVINSAPMAANCNARLTGRLQ